MGACFPTLNLVESMLPVSRSSCFSVKTNALFQMQSFEQGVKLYQFYQKQLYHQLSVYRTRVRNITIQQWMHGQIDFRELCIQSICLQFQCGEIICVAQKLLSISLSSDVKWIETNIQKYTKCRQWLCNNATDFGNAISLQTKT